MSRSARKQALDAVKVGDVIFGIAENGTEKLLFVSGANDRHIFTRHIGSQTRVKFGRNGKSHRTWDGGKCTIVSVASLPDEDYATAIGLDRKMRTGKQHPDWVLSKAEIDLLRHVGDYFNAHPLPKA